MIEQIPRSLYNNRISEKLDYIYDNYKRLSGKGLIKGLICLDQDAKIIAINRMFDKRFNMWDLGSIGTILFQATMSAKDYVEADDLERISVIFGNTQIFVKSIGKFYVGEYERDLVLLALCNKSVNIGLIVLQMKKIAADIKAIAEREKNVKHIIKTSEDEYKQYMRSVKSELAKNSELMKTMT